MDLTALTRRSFLGTAAGIAATVAVSTIPPILQANSVRRFAGAVYGRVGRNGISPGTSDAPSRGEVILLDGTALAAAHANGRRILAGTSVLLSPDESGEWSVLYAEL
jgi:hypothetical protein